MRKMKLFYPLLCAGLMSVGAQAQKLVMMSNPEVPWQYIITQVSPNGEWAVGNIANEAGQAFVWNLKTNKITNLSPRGIFSFAYRVSNNGVVSGAFNDSQATSYGVTIENGGYWKNGRWHHLDDSKLDEITKSTNGSLMNGVSPDGNYVGGLALVGGKWTPVAWNLEKGEMSTYPYMNGAGAIYDIADNGMAGGYTYDPVKKNRTPVLWKSTSAADSVMVSLNTIGPAALVSSISSDRKYALADTLIYNIETGERTPILKKGHYDYFNFEYFGINKQGTVWGYYADDMGSYKPALVKNGEAIDVNAFFAEKGFDTSNYMILHVNGVSDDEKTYAVQAIDQMYMPHAMIIKLDQNTTTPAPVALEAHAHFGIKAVELSWSAPLFADVAPTAYDVYRDGTKVASVAAGVTDYVDAEAAEGSHSYAVKAVYEGGESDLSDAADVELVAPVLTAPANLKAEARGLNNVYLYWNAPRTSKERLNYFNDGLEVTGLGGGTTVFECAVRFKQTVLAAYAAKGQKVTEVAFYPMAKQKAWTINFYRADDTATPVYTQSIDASKLIYGQENIVKLTTPLELPAEGDLIYAIKAEPLEAGSYNVIGLVDGTGIAGYTDLMRRTEDGGDFTSLHEDAFNNADGGFDYNSTYAMSLLFGTEASDAAEVKAYKVLQNGTLAATVESTNAVLKGLEDGTYSYEVKAVYADDSEGPAAAVTATVALDVENVPSVKNVDVAVEGAAMKAEWDAPADDSRATISYSDETLAGGLVGTEENNYSYLVKAIYDGDKLNGMSGYQIKAFRFYPLAQSDFTFFLYKDGVKVAEKFVESYNLNEWNEVALDEPLTLDASSAYELVLDSYDVEPGKAPLGLDGRLAHAGYSNLFSTDEGKTFSTTDGSGNWMIGLVTGEPEATPLAVEGYNVLIDGRETAPEPIKETTYSQEFSEKGTHSIKVNVVYPEPLGEFSGTTVFFEINVSGIDKLTADELTFTRGEHDGVIRVNGGEVAMLHIFSASGAKAASARGSEINVSQLTPGAYVLSVTMLNGKVKTAKVVLK